MCRQRSVLCSSFAALAILAGGASGALGQNAPGQTTRVQRAGSVEPPGTTVPNAVQANPLTGLRVQQTGGVERPEITVQNALRANPVTAPYAIATTWSKGAVVLSGRVGTKPIHDAAVQLAIACGYPFRDDLVIDTAETFRVAMSSTPSMSGYAALAPNLSASYYVYPQPLFGRLDDPFFGMVPPLVSFPPWQRRRVDGPIPAPNGGAGQTAPNSAAAPVPVADPSGVSSAADDARDPLNPPPVKGDLEITVDAAGQVFLRGVVASAEVAREIEQTAWSVPGVTRVVTQFQVQPRRADVPPPPPEPVTGPASPERLPAPAAPGIPPFQVQPRRADAPSTPFQPDTRPAPPAPPGPGVVVPPAKPATVTVAALDSQRVTRRVVESLQRRPPVADLPIKVRSTGDAVMLSGRVPSAYEAMLAYRAAQQTPGVRDIVDRLEFLVPDEDHPNPLVQKGRPEDLEPYLTAQMGRHVGDLAHIDSVRARGDLLQIRGTLLSAADKDRVLAILRSIPVLHGFRLDSMLTSD